MSNPKHKTECCEYCLHSKPCPFHKKKPRLWDCLKCRQDWKRCKCTYNCHIGSNKHEVGCQHKKWTDKEKIEAQEIRDIPYVSKEKTECKHSSTSYCYNCDWRNKPHKEKPMEKECKHKWEFFPALKRCEECGLTPKEKPMEWEKEDLIIFNIAKDWIKRADFNSVEKEAIMGFVGYLGLSKVISNLLKSQRKEFVEMVEGVKITHQTDAESKLKNFDIERTGEAKKSATTKP